MSKLKNKKNKYISNITNIITDLNNNKNNIDTNHIDTNHIGTNHIDTNHNQNFITHIKNKKKIFDQNEKIENNNFDYLNIKIEQKKEQTHEIKKELKKELKHEIKKELSSVNDEHELSCSNDEQEQKSSKINSTSSSNDSQKKSINISCSSSNNNDKNIYKKIQDKNIFFNELLKKQINGIPSDKKLNYNDIKRISKFIKSSIFDINKCSIWEGYVTNGNNNFKGIYINFYFNKKKMALHRLLYINYMGILSDNEYLKFSCENKGRCCNINHMKKYSYNINYTKNSTNTTNINDEKTNKHINNDISEPIQINVDKKKLIVEI